MIPIDFTDDMIIRAYKRRDELYAFTDWSKHDENSCETCKMLEERDKIRQNRPLSVEKGDKMSQNKGISVIYLVSKYHKTI